MSEVFALGVVERRLLAGILVALLVIASRVDPPATQLTNTWKIIDWMLDSLALTILWLYAIYVFVTP